ncbi:hypothetical protein BKA62DRAFT_44401 [Auriculariales sp. MPI-PUGE-AT-0066]|nr:hypothetical protein BKA62DRAFT_44401 [Auriculariales sp. MPI-PUGE-AT-0066]
MAASFPHIQAGLAWCFYKGSERTSNFYLHCFFHSFPYPLRHSPQLWYRTLRLSRPVPIDVAIVLPANLRVINPGGYSDCASFAKFSRKSVTDRFVITEVLGTVLAVTSTAVCFRRSYMPPNVDTRGNSLTANPASVASLSEGAYTKHLGRVIKLQTFNFLTDPSGAMSSTLPMDLQDCWVSRSDSELQRKSSSLLTSRACTMCPHVSVERESLLDLYAPDYSARTSHMRSLTRAPCDKPSREHGSPARTSRDALESQDGAMHSALALNGEAVPLHAAETTRPPRRERRRPWTASYVP